MATQSPHCKPKQLKRLLAGSLADALAVDVADHLGECDSCRLQLETLEAEDTWWEDAKQFLADVDDDRVFIDDSPTTGETIQLVDLAVVPDSVVEVSLGNPAVTP